MCDENVFQSLAKYEPYEWNMRRLRSKIRPKVLIFKQASNENVELLPFEKPYPNKFWNVDTQKDVSHVSFNCF